MMKMNKLISNGKLPKTNELVEELKQRIRRNEALRCNNYPDCTHEDCVDLYQERMVLKEYLAFAQKVERELDNYNGEQDSKEELKERIFNE